MACNFKQTQEQITQYINTMKSKVILHADEAYRNGDFEFALNNYLDYLFDNEASAEIFLKIAHCNKMLGENENAVEYYEKSLEMESQNYEALFNYAESLMYIGRYDDGLDAISRLIDITGNTGMEIHEVAKSKKLQIESQKHNYLGGLLMNEQRYDEAKAEFLTAIALFPQDKRNYANIGVICLKKENKDAAIEWMQKAIEVDKNYVRGYYNLGTLLMQKSLFKQAIGIYTKALDIEPNGRDSEDISRNLAVAEQNILIPKTELINILTGKIPHIDNANVLEISNSVFHENILSLDFIVAENGNYRIIAYCDKNKYEICTKNNDLHFVLIE